MRYTIQKETLESIADAIRTKTGGSDKLSPSAMAEAISDIQTGVDIKEPIVTAKAAEAIQAGKFVSASNITMVKLNNYSEDTISRKNLFYQFKDANGNNINKFLVVSICNNNSYKTLFSFGHFDNDTYVEDKVTYNTGHFYYGVDEPRQIFKTSDGKFHIIFNYPENGSKCALGFLTFEINEETGEVTYIGSSNITGTAKDSHGDYQYPIYNDPVTSIGNDEFIIQTKWYSNTGTYHQSTSQSLIYVKYNSENYKFENPIISSSYSYSMYFGPNILPLDQDNILVLSNNSYQYNYILTASIYNIDREQSRFLNKGFSRYPSSGTINYLLGNNISATRFKFIKKYDAANNIYIIFVFHPTTQGNFLGYTVITVDMTNNTVQLSVPVQISTLITGLYGNSKIICVDEENQIYEMYTGQWYYVTFKIKSDNTVEIINYQKILSLGSTIQYNNTNQNYYTFENKCYTIIISTWASSSGIYYAPLNFISKIYSATLTGTKNALAVTEPDSDNYIDICLVNP